MSNELRDLMFYQHCHDKNYHHDIFILSRQKRLNHLIHHLHKYNMAAVKPAHWIEDMFACLLSMAGTMNMHLSQEIGKMLFCKVVKISDITNLYAAEIIHTKLNDNLRLLSKTMESLDHVEVFDFNRTLLNCITELTIITFQLNALENEEDNWYLVQRYMKRLDMIKERHCFHEYFDHNLRLGHKSYVNLRVEYLKEASVKHYIHADQTVYISQVG